MGRKRRNKKKPEELQETNSDAEAHTFTYIENSSKIKSETIIDNQNVRRVKKIPSKSLHITKASKNAIKFILCWPSEPTHLRVFYISSEIPLEKYSFSFGRGYQLQIASGLEIWGCVHLPS